jgi:hypothetical protein
MIFGEPVRRSSLIAACREAGCAGPEIRELVAFESPAWLASPAASEAI